MIQLLSIFLFGITIFATSKAVSSPLQAYAWESRILVVSTPDAENKAYKKQMEDIDRNWKGYEDREMVVFVLEGPSARIRPHQPDEVSADQLRNQLRMPEKTFEALLIGKDGGIKGRSDNVIEACDLFSLIDAMPMRQDEINDQGFAIPCKDQ